MLILAAFTKLDWLILTGYFALIALVGWIASRKKADAEGYFLADRSMPMWAIALSVVATSLSVATFLGAPEQSYSGDLTYLSLNLGGFVAVFAVAGLFIPRLYRAGTVTIYGYIDQRLGEGPRIAVSCMFLLGRLVASGVRLFFAAIPVCLLLFSDPESHKPFHISAGQYAMAILLIGVVGTLYTIAGGIRAVIWTDVIQIGIILGAVLLSIGLLYGRIPLSAGEIVDVLRHAPGKYHDGGSKLRLLDFSWNTSHSFTLWTALIGATFLNTAAYGVDHDMAQRLLTARSPMRGSLSLIASQFVTVTIGSLFMLVGLLLYIYYRRPDLMGAAAPSSTPEGSAQVFAYFLLHHFPRGLAGLAMAGIFAVAQGSLVSAINAMASSVVSDVYWPFCRRTGRPVDASTKAPRLAVAAMGAVLILFAIAAALVYDEKQTTLLDFALDVMSFAYSGMLAVFLTALLTKRGSTASVLLALATGVLVTLVLWGGVMPWWSQRLLGRTLQVAGFWRMPIATAFAFSVCLLGGGKTGGVQTRPNAKSRS